MMLASKAAFTVHVAAIIFLTIVGPVPLWLRVLLTFGWLWLPLSSPDAFGKHQIRCCERENLPGALSDNDAGGYGIAVVTRGMIDPSAMRRFSKP